MEMLKKVKGWLGGDTLVQPQAAPKAGKFSRWLGEVTPGRWVTLWRGSDPYRYCSGAQETQRRRLRILGLRGAPFAAAELRADYLTSLAEARKAEYPLAA